METSLTAGERCIFSLNAVISKAHRRVLVRGADWEVQACRTSATSVGALGVASAASWWSRLMGLVGRFGLQISACDCLFVLCFVDDLDLAVGGNTRWLTLWRFLVIMEMVGVPFSYHKFRGGFPSDSAGFYLKFEVGLSEKRTSWLVEFTKEMADDWLVNVKRFQELDGRLGFSGQVLCRLRPVIPWIRLVGCFWKGGRVEGS